MLATHFGEDFGRGAGSSGGHIGIAPADGFDGLFRILALPFEIGTECFVERRGRVLAVALGVLLQLGAALGLERNQVHIITRVKRKSARYSCQAPIGIADGIRMLA